MKLNVLYFFLLSFLLFACKNTRNETCNYITDYYPLVYEAELEYWEENYEKAFELYKTAFNNCNPKNTPILNELLKITEIAAILNKKEVAIDYMLLSIKNGSDIQSFKNDSIFQNVLKSQKGQELIKNYDSLRHLYLQGININLRHEFQSMQLSDQLYRGRGPEHWDWEKQDSLDNLNTKRLIEIFEEIGFPDEHILGHTNIDWSPTNINGILLHTEDSIRMNYFVPKMKEFISQGHAEPTILGNMIDQYHLYKDKPQVYGTYQAQDNYYATMIDDRETINQNRLSIGLSTLEVKEKLDSIKCVKQPHFMGQSCEKLFRYLSKK